MKYKSMQEIETRKAAILQEMEQDGADLDALKAEMEELRQNAEEIQKAANQAAETRRQIANGAAGIQVQVVESHGVDGGATTLDEIRSSKAYIDAYANYIRTGKADECRKLLSTNAASNGQVPVPTMVDEIVRTAWERNELLSRVRRTYFRGNLKVPFERAGDDAYVHPEGTTAVTEEDLTLGIVELKPENIKKWIKISDEAVTMGGEAFLRYIYDEITYRVLKKLADQLVTDVKNASTSHSGSAVGIPKVTEAPSVTTIENGAANLSDEATNLAIVMNRLTETNFTAARAAGNFAMDPFAGLPRIYTSALPAYNTASAGDTYAIVGDLDALQVNYPEGDDVLIKWDDLSLAEEDLVKVIGRQYAGHGVTAPGRLVRICKPSATTT